MNEISLLKNNEVSTQSKPMIEVINDFAELKNSKHTQRAYINDLSKFFNGADIIMLEDLGIVPFSQIVTILHKHIEGIKDIEQLEDRARVKNSRTVNRKINSLKSFFNYLMQVYNYPKNPLNQFNNLKTPKHSNTQSLSRAEVIDLLERAKREHRTNEAGYRNYLIIIFLFNLALRVEEVANLQWDDLNLNDQEANIYQKGGSYKLLPIPQSLCLLLQEFKALYGDTCPYILHPLRNNSHKELNKPLNVSYIFRLIQKMAYEVVPDKKITPHSLRKTFIEQALNNGDDLISISNATGHNTVEMIKYYDTRDKLKNNSINSLSGLI